MRCVTVSDAEVKRAVIPVFHCLHAKLRRRRALAVRGMITFGSLGLSASADSYKVRVSVASW